MSFLFRHSKDTANGKGIIRKSEERTAASSASDDSARAESALPGSPLEAGLSHGSASASANGTAYQNSIAGRNNAADHGERPAHGSYGSQSDLGEGSVRRWRASSAKHATGTTRKEAVLQACSQWREELQQRALSGVSADILRKATVDLTHIHPTGAAQLFSGAATMLSSLVREERSYQRASAQIGELHNAVMRLRDSYGYVSLALTAERAVWVSAGSEEPALASSPKSLSPAQMPMLFRPAKVTFLPDGDAKIRMARSIEINPHFRSALIQAGASEGELDAVQTLADSSAGVDGIIARLAELGRAHLQQFDHEAQTLLGCFAHPSGLLLQDFESVKPFIEGSRLVAALAGDSRMRDILSAPLPSGAAQDRAPELERGVGDCDVDEQNIVETAASGRSFVIDCPPGSRRLSTIVSIAADSAASGRSVIIVPAHASDGEALQRECEAAGIGELTLNFWDTDAVALRLRLGLRLEKPAIDKDAILAVRDELIDGRMKLTTFVNDLHRKDPQWETSVHDVLQELAELTRQPDGPRTRVRFPEKYIRQIHDTGIAAVEEDVMKAAGLGIFDGSYSHSLWFTSGVSNADEVERALTLAHELSDGIMPRVIQESSQVSQRTGLVLAQTPAQWVDQVSMLDGISESLDTFLPKVFERSPEDMVIATATKEWREERDCQMKASVRRLIRKQAEDLVRPGAAPKDIHAELKLVQERQELWRKHSADGGWPILPPNFSQIRAQSAEITNKLNKLSQLFGGEDFMNMPWQKIMSALAALEEEEQRTDSLPERNLLLKKLLSLGLEVFIEDMKARGISGEAVRQEFRLACVSSVFERLMVESPILASLGPQDISVLLSRVRELDKAHVTSLAGPVIEAAIMNMRNFARAHRDSALSLDAILARDNSEAVQEGINAYPRIVQLARPIWIMPAGLIAEFIPSTPWADLMILDAGADVALSSVLPAMVRGRQVIIAGDTRRSRLVEVSGAQSMPAWDAASDHSSRTGQENESPNIPERAISAFAQVLPVLQLPTHRVQLNELTTLALSQHGYNGVYSPIAQNPRLHSARLMLVEGRGMPSLGGDGAVESTAAEVDAVIDAIVDHALDRPYESLAVIAGNERHALRIREAFKKEIAGSATLYDFVQRNQTEPFEILDISQASGLHRDHVILAVGFGKTIHGRVLHSFGLLASSAGFLGLVNAIESARGELTVISALGPEDFDRNRISMPGPMLLASLIEAADKGFESTAAGAEDTAGVAPLLDDLAARLERQGWKTARNFGYEGSSRIPLVAGSSDIPGIWAVAVLLDDDAYVNERSMRRRDRYRVEAYEKAGWKVFQTYSTSLFIDPAGQAQAIAALIESVRTELNHPREAVVVPHLDMLGDAVDGSDSYAGSAKDEASRVASVSGVSASSVEQNDEHSDKKLVTADAADRGEDAAQSLPHAPMPRPARPGISVGLPLAAYTDDELDDMLVWISADAVPRTADELREELRKELGIERRGGQIDRVLANVVRRSGLAQDQSRQRDDS